MDGDTLFEGFTCSDVHAKHAHKYYLGQEGQVSTACMGANAQCMKVLRRSSFCLPLVDEYP